MTDYNDEKHKNNELLVVGLGASASGINPLKDFFKSLPDDIGMAFIVVLHLAPDKKSRLGEILQRETSLEVRQVQKRTKIERNHVYIIPPDKLLSVENNYLILSEPEKKHRTDSIDLLFRTLAQKKKKYSAGIIFSGTESDGTTGMRIIREEGGFTIAQQPEEAQYSGMPASVIDIGVVDKILHIEEMAEELVQYREALYKIRLAEQADKFSDNAETEKILSRIFDQIWSKTEHDFINYRRSSVLRQIDRRMRINRIQALTKYASYIEKHPEEAEKLYKDLLISVTHFFRDRQAFKAVENQLIPKLFEGKEKNQQVRVWVPACATGEEAYSLAILLLEHAKEKSMGHKIQLFASDVDKDSLAVARAGRYPKSIENNVSEERLQQFFEEDNLGYKVKKELREMILFSDHDLLRNPPFSKLDLISCRNLLIYLNKDLHTEVFNLFHYALREEGYLFLGKSDSKIGGEDLFEAVDKEFRIYNKIGEKHSRVPLPNFSLLYKSEVSAENFDRRSSHHNSTKSNLEKIHWSILARVYAQPSVLITDNYEVIHATDGISRYLEYAGGEPSRNILEMIKPDLRQNLRWMLYQLKKGEKTRQVQKKFQLESGGEYEYLEIIVRQFSETEFPKELIHIVFKELPKKPEKKTSKRKKSEQDEKKTDIIDSLENELEFTKEQLQLSVEEYETSNQELRASNEKLQSMNEELQSTTEELETSQEELQSANEELKTINDQLESKVEELSNAHSDLENLMEATEVGVIFVDRSYCIQRFTSASTEIFNLIESDKGRPLLDITHSLKYDGLSDDIKQVLDSLDKIKKGVSTKNGRWFIMRLRPYRSSQNKIDGVVLSFMEFTELKEARETIEEQTFQETLATLGVYALEMDDLTKIMHRAIQQSCALLDLECAIIMLLSDDDKTLDIAMEAGCGCEEADIKIENDEKWDVGYSIQSKKPINVLDYGKEGRFSISPCMEEGKFTSSAHIAIRGTEKTFGVFGVYSEQKREFSKMELHFIQVVANILGRSMEQKMFEKELLEVNSQLQQEMKRTRQVKREIINNNVLERWELGGYLHDNLGQLLASVKILAGDIQYKLSTSDDDVTAELEEVNKIMDECLAGIRNVIHDIIPVDVEQEGVAQAFRIVMNQTFKMYDVRCLLEEDEILNEIKKREVATHLYHIVQEAFKNAATHGKADLIIISPQKVDDNFVLQIKDDGVGLKATKNGNGKGIRIMQHRMDLLGGSFKIEEYSDGDESGTVVTCTLPMENLKKYNETEE